MNLNKMIDKVKQNIIQEDEYDYSKLTIEELCELLDENTTEQRVMEIMDR